MIKIGETEIIISDIKCIIPWHSRILLRPVNRYVHIADNLKESSLRFFVVVNDVKPETLKRLKFEYVRYLKTKKDPQDRVADFEWHNEDGLPDFKRLDKLIASRKTRKERQIEIDDQIEIIKLMKQQGIDTTASEEILKLTMRGEI